MKQQYQKKIGIKRIVSALFNSVKGLKYLLKKETSFIQEFIGFILLLPVIFLVNVSSVEKILLLFTIIFVLIVEILNTAVEIIVDRISLSHHFLSGLAKDLGSLAVLLSIIFAIIVWLIILL